MVFSRVTRVAGAGYVSDDRVKANSLTALADGGSVEGSKSDQGILVGGGWADMSAVNTELEKTMAAWYRWTIRHSVVATRQWQPVESLERATQ